jgi:hypothetical protein
MVNVILVLVFLLISLNLSQSRAAIYLLDGKVKFKGRLEEFVIVRTRIPDKESEWHDTNLGIVRSLASLEGMFTLAENENLLVNLYSWVRYYYEAVPDIDDQLADGIPSRVQYKEYQVPRYLDEDFLEEFYLNVVKGDWELRLGKQKVVWGEGMELIRTVDVINPLDLRYSQPGIDPFDEIKVGIWMVRARYQSSLPGDLSFEAIFNPGDFKRTRVPLEGTFWGPSIPDTLGPNGIFQRLVEKWDHDLPGFNVSNYELGFRIRGTTSFGGRLSLIDWTLNYFNTLDDTPVIKSNRIDEFNLHFGTGIIVPRLTGRPSQPFPSIKLFDYKRLQLFGFTFQTYIDRIQSVVRWESTYERKRHFNTDMGTPGTPVTGLVDRDSVSFGLAIDRPTRIPTKQWGGRGILDITLGWFQTWMLHHDHKIDNQRGRGDNSSTAFTLLLLTDFHNKVWVPVFKILYDTSNWGYWVFALVYGPGQHMRYEVGAMEIWANDPNDFDSGY